MPETAVGKKIKCPKCGKIMEVPSPVAVNTSVEDKTAESDLLDALAQDAQNGRAIKNQQLEAELTLSELTKNCPYCGETILEVAKKCKHCGEFLINTENTNFSYSGKKSNLQYVNNSYENETLGVFILIIPVISIFLLLFWIGNMALIDRPQSKYWFIIIATVLSTSILAMIEATQLGIGKNVSGKRETGPIGWFCCFILLWIVAYPAYLYKRSKYGLKNYCIGGILIGLTYIVVSILIGGAIESRIQEFNDSINNLNNLFN